MEQYVIGLDYGTDSVRAVLVNTKDGSELASSVYWYSNWAAGKYCEPARNRFRQHPTDYLEGLEHTVRAVMKESGTAKERVKGICVDTTGSSPIAVTRSGTPLALTQGFEHNPNAMTILWKDHTAIREANEINLLAKNWGGTDFTKYEGGIYSSEWFWAKIWHIIRNDKEVKEHAYSWVEHCDLMTHLLVGNTDIKQLKRSRCAAGHKAMWHKDWDGLPPVAFLEQLDPYLATLRSRLYEESYTSDTLAGNLSSYWADRLGLSTETVVAVGTFDAHAGAVGASIERRSLVRVMGTSTCDIIVADYKDVANKTVRGICGQVDGSVIPGMIGLEAGQSAFGDVLAWFKELLMWPIENLVLTSDQLSDEQKQELEKEIHNKLIEQLTKEAEAIPLSESIPTALDWVNGRRTPDANQELKSALKNISLGTKAPHVFKALVNAICFGSKKIVDRFEEEGIEINKIIGIGGVARKSPFIMQTLANVLKRPIEVASSDYAPALGAAIYAAVAAGIHKDVFTAAKVMGSKIEAAYLPGEKEEQAMRSMMDNYDSLAAFIEKISV